MGIIDRDWYHEARREREEGKGLKAQVSSRQAARSRSARQYPSVWLLAGLVVALLVLLLSRDDEHLEGLNLQGAKRAIKSALSHLTTTAKTVLPPSSVVPPRTMEGPPLRLTERDDVSGSRARTLELVLFPSPTGNFYADGTINGQDVIFMVDTGASYVSVPERFRSRLKLSRGQYFQMHTASDVVGNYTTQIDALSIGPIHLQGVKGNLNPRSPDDFVLLGMSALRNLELTHANGRLILRQTLTVANQAQRIAHSEVAPPRFKRHLSACMGPDRVIDNRVVACMEGD